MPNLPISRLVSGTQANDGDKFVYVQQGITKQIDFGDSATSVRLLDRPLSASTAVFTNDVKIEGNLSVTTLESSSIIYSSGSTIFGDTLDDTHQFTGSIYLTGSIEEADYIDFSTSSIVEGKPGRLRWNDMDGTLDLTLKNGNVTLQMGQEQVINAYNNTGAPLLESEYKAVFFSGSSGRYPAMNLSTNLSRQASENTVGIVTEDIGSGSLGYITTQGLVRDIDMSAYSPGDTLYLGLSDGILINTPPAPPALTVIMGYCINNDATTGSMFVNVRSGFEYPQYTVAYNLSNHTASVNTATVIDFDNPSIQSGILLENGSQFKATTPGLYNFTLMAQLNRATSSGTDTMYFWLRKNGVNVENTTTNITMVGNANQVAKLLSKDFVIVLEEDDYIEFVWATTSEDLILKYTPAGTNPTRPATPAVKATAARVS